MHIRIDRRIALVAVGLALAAGGGGAYAAVRATAPSPAQERQAFLDDLAKRLGVTSAQLTDALKGALEDRLQAAVAAGRLTQAQADELKSRIESGDGPFPGVGPFFGGRGHASELHRLGLSAAASYLGLSRSELASQLRSGKTLAQIATAQGKSVDGLVTALVDDAKQKLDQAVKDGRLAQAQEDVIIGAVRARIEALVQGGFARSGFFFHAFRGGPPAPLAPPG